MIITAYQCTKCGDIMYSRAQHDFRRCSCGDIFVDGGFDYTRIGFTSAEPKRKKVALPASVTPQVLYMDWNNNTNKYGRIPAENGLTALKQTLATLEKENKKKQPRKKSTK